MYTPNGVCVCVRVLRAHNIFFSRMGGAFNMSRPRGPWFLNPSMTTVNHSAASYKPEIVKIYFTFLNISVSIHTNVYCHNKCILHLVLTLNNTHIFILVKPQNKTESKTQCSENLQIKTFYAPNCSV